MGTNPVKEIVVQIPEAFTTLNKTIEKNSP
jgi:hypothetical protein